MRLDSDNPETMPITDGVYGRHQRRGTNRPIKKTAPLWTRLDQATLDALARRYQPARRFAARQRQGG